MEGLVKHFVAYHIRDKEGPFKGLHEGQTRFWDSAKGYKAETIEGSRLWAIEGGGSPRRYFLHGSGIITRLRPKRGVQYRVKITRADESGSMSISAQFC